MTLPRIPDLREAPRHSTVATVSRLMRASCLESALVRQRWLAAAGDRRDLVLGVTAPATGFRAHAWLEGDRVDDGFSELSRFAAPPVPVPRLPDFVVIGAPKSGTTSLWSYLRAHPQIYMTPEKEPEFFNDEEHWSRGVSWYERLFADAGDALVVGEASVRYAAYRPASASVPQRMAGVIPDAKLVYVVRHPVHRMVSTWWHNRAYLREARDRWPRHCAPPVTRATAGTPSGWRRTSPTIPCRACTSWSTSGWPPTVRASSHGCSSFSESTLICRSRESTKS